jgi:prefoldin subunit 5
MIEERIQKCETAVKKAADISAEKKAELLGQLARLRSDLGKVSDTHPEAAQKIAQYVEDVANEATRPKKEPELFKGALQKLKESVEKFESSHPELVERVNEFATILADMGL